MLWYLGVLMTIGALVMPSLKAQCIDCSREWGTDCEANETGYYCEPGSFMVNFEKKPEDAVDPETRSQLYANCVPDPLDLRFVQNFCCIYSPEFGCQVAIHPRMYEFEHNPVRMCKFCEEKCRCILGGTPRSGADKRPAWSWVKLCSLALTLTVAPGLALSARAREQFLLWHMANDL